MSRGIHLIYKRHHHLLPALFYAIHYACVIEILLSGMLELLRNVLIQDIPTVKVIDTHLINLVAISEPDTGASFTSGRLDYA
jgi:hypothetical protein